MFSTSHSPRRGLARPATPGPSFAYKLTSAERRAVRRRALFAYWMWGLAFVTLGGTLLARLIG